MVLFCHKLFSIPQSDGTQEAFFTVELEIDFKKSVFPMVPI